MKTIRIFVFFVLLPAGMYAQSRTTVRSPNKDISFLFSVENKVPRYQVLFKGKPLVQSSAIDFSFIGNAHPQQLKVLPATTRKGVEAYKLVVGKASSVRDEYNEAIIPMEYDGGQTRINLTVRVFDDGLALRYGFDRVRGLDSLKLSNEELRIQLPSNTMVRTLQLSNFTSSHEGFYTTATLNELSSDVLMDLPTLFEVPGVAFLGVTEAALLNYAGMYIIKSGGSLRTTLSPWPGQAELKVKAAFPHQSPWRVMLISDRVGALIESNIITDLNAPCALEDVSWIKPGKTTFPWWNGNVVPDTLNAPGNNFVTQQYYIDFCARTGLEYHSVVEYGLHQWYRDDGVGFQPGPHADVTRPVPGLDMKEVCDYAASKGVGVRVWVHWGALYPKLDSAFMLFEQWGLQGMMVDFMDRDDQQMVNIQNEILRKAAAHHLHVQFHGAYKPTGLHRTWPNEFTREGTLNYEVNKWDDDGLPPDHDINIPFTRMLAGSTDYHLGGFRAVPDKDYRQQYTRPLMRGTRCHMLAMYVVLENYLGMVCDYPVAYEGEPGFDFIQAVPTTWDETRVVDARAGEYIVIARRKGSQWYLGAITNHEGRDVKVDLGFLAPGMWKATTYADAADAPEHPNHLDRSVRDVKAGDMLSVHLVPGGGATMILRQQE